MKKILLLSAFLLIAFVLKAQIIEIKANGNLRSGPGTENPITGKVTAGLKVSQLDISGDWYKIELPGKSTGWIFKALIKTGKPVEAARQQMKDTVALAAFAIADEIKKAIIVYMKNEFFRTPLAITTTYPLEISLSSGEGGNLKIEGKTEDLSLGGNMSINTNGDLKVIAYPKSEVGTDESTRPALNISGKVTLQDNSNKTKAGVMIFTTSGTSVNEDSFVQCFKAAKFDCSGIFSVNDSIAVSFESGTIVFTDNEKECAFSEGAVMNYNTAQYIFTNSKWTRK